MRKLIQNPPLAAFIGVLTVLPFFVFNLIANYQIEPLYSGLGLGALSRMGPGLVIFVIVTLAMPAGAVISALPMLRRFNGGARKFYPVNAAVTVLLLALFGLITMAIGRGA